MKISIIQAALVWENRAANLQNFEKKLAPLAGTTDVVVLPEMFTTGFSMNAAELAEPMSGATVRWMKRQARRLGAVVTGSFICLDRGRFFNRLVWMQPDGKYFSYDKRHLFGLAGESKVFSAGKKRMVVEWQGLRICPMICYDLRFPVWSRNRTSEPFDVLIYLANWPAPRVAHWSSLLPARAIENQSWTIGVNIVGTDGNGMEYSGASAICDHSGRQICQIVGQEGIATAEILPSEIREFRAKLPFLQDADDFRLT